MYRLKFDYISGGLPVLADSYGNDVPYNGYIVGSKFDPHWKPYNKNEWPCAKNYLSLGTAVTDFDWGDGIHFGMYMVGDIIHEPIHYKYSELLRKHFDTVHKYSQDACMLQINKKRQEEEQQALSQQQALAEQKQGAKERIKQLNSQKKEAQRQIENEEKVIKEYEKVKNSHVRYLVRSENMSKDQAGQIFDQENAPQKKMYDQAQYQIAIYKNNIIISDAELKELKKLV